MQVVPLGTQFATDARGAFWPSVQVALSGDQNVQTMDEASYGGKMFYLQMEGGAIQWPKSQPIQVVPNLNFFRNQKMIIWQKYKSNFGKYCKSEMEKYLNISAPSSGQICN